MSLKSERGKKLVKMLISEYKQKRILPEKNQKK